MRSLQDLDRLVVADQHPRGGRAELEIVRRQSVALVCCGERLVRLEPGASRIRGPRAVQGLLNGAHRAYDRMRSV